MLLAIRVPLLLSVLGPELRAFGLGLLHTPGVIQVLLPLLGAAQLVDISVPPPDQVLQVVQLPDLQQRQAGIVSDQMLPP
jgi:hypothetical protein